MKMNINELAITDVSHCKVEHIEYAYSITFKIDGFGYRIYVNGEKNGTVHPTGIMHADDEEDCTYCKVATYMCLELNKYSTELFHRLIEFPSTRLEWLFINHV